MDRLPAHGNDYDLNEELQLIQDLLDPRIKERCMCLFKSLKSRKKFIQKLPHHNVFNDRYKHKIESSKDTVENILATLRSKKAPDTCYVISADPELDRKIMTLEDALHKIHCYTMGSIICCIPGKLLYYEEEMIGDRYYIEAN